VAAPERSEGASHQICQLFDKSAKLLRRVAFEEGILHHHLLHVGGDPERSEGPSHQFFRLNTNPQVSV
jgi:hypothetical protein